MSAEQIISAPKLIVRDLNFYYGADRALKDINLVIPEKMVSAFIPASSDFKISPPALLNLMPLRLSGM